MHLQTNPANGQAAAAASSSSPPSAQTYRIASMDCAVEESEIRVALEGIAGIKSLGFRLRARSLAITADEATQALAVAAIRGAGFDPQPLADDAAPPAPQAECCGGHDQGHQDQQGHSGPGTRPTPTTGAWPTWTMAFEGPRRLALALTLAIAAEALAFAGAQGLAWTIAGQAIAALAIWLAGFGVYQKGLAALRRGRLNINALMTVAVTGAFLIGQWPEAAMVMALYAIAELIEAHAVDRARGAITGLMALAPDKAEVQQPAGGWLVQAAASVAVGATVRVRPGQRVPLDGVLSAGSTSIDQSSVTGESLPVDKAVGDPVFAGTVNQEGMVDMRVTAAASQSTLTRIIQAVEQAQSSRAPTQRFVDRFAAAYTPAVFGLALAVALAGPWVFGWTALVAVYKALVLLVIACPCALVISTPVTVVSGLAAAARRGILIKGGVHLEQARLLKAIALDKTGTLTVGKPKLVDWQVLDAETDHANAERIAAALAAHSDHPVARAIAAGLQPNAVSPTAFQALTGRGVQAELEGETYVLGNHRLIEERGQCTPEIEALLRAHEAQGHTVSLLATTARVLALFAVADQVKPTSAAAVAELKALGITPVMLSGDNPATAQAIAALAGISEVQGNLLPEDKLFAISALRAQHGPTAMVGDGINDAPALAHADIGFAMGAAGTDIAMEAADVVVMNDNLSRVAETVRLSRQTHRVLWQNIVLALGIKALFLLLAVFDNASMWMAVFADMGASLLVVGNGLRLLRFRAGSASEQPKVSGRRSLGH